MIDKLYTDRLVIRKFSKTDYKDAYEYLSDDDVCEIGWILNKSYQGKEYAFEISRALIKYGFEEFRF